MKVRQSISSTRNAKVPQTNNNNSTSLVVKNINCEWYEDKINITPPPKSTKYKSKNVKIQLFAEISGILDLEFLWKNNFENMSNNKFPSGFSYNIKENKMVFRTPSKQESLDLSNKNLIEIKDDIISFIKKYGGIFSEKDYARSYENKLKLFEANSISEFTWFSCQKKTKEIFKIYFINEMAEKYNLNKEKKDKLKFLINNATVTKKFHKDDFIFNNYTARLQSIIGVEYSETKQEFILNIPEVKKQNSSKKTASRKTKIECNQFFAKWKVLCLKQYGSFSNNEDENKNELE